MKSAARFVLGPSFVVFTLAGICGSASAQNAPTVQGMPPVSSPNAPATQSFPAPPAQQAAPAPAPKPYTPQPLPAAPVLAPVAPVPGGTTTSQLGPSAGGPLSNAPLAGPAIQEQLTALIGRSGGLTADQAAARAKQTSYDVRARKAEAVAAQSSVDQATAAYVPRLKGTVSYQRTSPVSLSLAAFGFPGSFAYPEDNWNLEIDGDVPLSDYVLKIAKQHSAAEHSARAAQLTARAAELTASSNARIQYYAWARARLQEVVAEDAYEQAKAHFGDANAEYAAGKASQADLLGVQAEVAQNQLLVVRAKDAVGLEEDRLRTTLHDDSVRPYEIGEALLADLPTVPGEENLGALYKEALDRRLELRSITESARGLRMQASANKMDMFPKLDAIGTAQDANPNPRYFPPTQVWHQSWGVGGAITWSDVDVLLGITNGHANEARAESTEAQALSMRDGIRDEVMQAFQAVHEAEAAIESTKQSLAAAEESYRVRRALFRADRATSTELSDSENALTRARFDVVNARIDLRIARVRLVHATGRDDVSGADRASAP
ncbi:MAG: TolC family protein [Polyangiaceae bacterium]